MSKTGRAIPYIYLIAGMLLAVTTAIGGCAGAGGTRETPPSADEHTTADNGQMPSCKTAIDDVTRYCSGDKASTGKCNDAKVRTREHCIN